jgi:cytochrome c peroxidase
MTREGWPGKAARLAACLAAAALTACGGGGDAGNTAVADGDAAAGTAPAIAASDWTWALPAHVSPPPVPADNPMTQAKFELGRSLFHDTRLSGTGIQSCASCHRQDRGFTDGLPLSRGATGDLTARNSQPLANVAWLPSLTWSRSDVITLEQQAEIPLFGTHPIEIGITDANRETVLQTLRSDNRLRQQFEAAFPSVAAAGQDTVNLPHIIQALATYQRGLISFNSVFDQFLQGQATLEPAAERGRALFFGERARCAQCHTADHLGQPFVAPGFHNTGLYNLGGQGDYPAQSPGLIEQTGLAADKGRFRVPSLRNAALTAPYLHDGSATTLAEVVAIYAAGGRVITEGPNAGDGRLNPFKNPTVQAIGEAGLTVGEQADLVAFLQSLTDTRFLQDPALGAP